MKQIIHIIGAGLSGLACAVKLAEQGYGSNVVLYEASKNIGGRCSSFHDNSMNNVLDNGTHMIMGANHNVMKFLKLIGSKDKLITSKPTSFHFIDLNTKEEWNIKPFGGALFPFWIFSKNRRVKDSTPTDYIKAGIRLILAKEGDTVKNCLFKDDKDKKMHDRLWQPLSESILNTSADKASAKLLRNVLLKTIFKGSRHCRPYVARNSLSDTFINPAVEYLRANGVAIKNNRLLKEVLFAGNRLDGKPGVAKQLVFAGPYEEKENVRLQVEPDRDFVVLATPPKITARLLNDLGEMDFPRSVSPIVNIHFLVDEKKQNNEPSCIEPKCLKMKGIVGGNSHWLFYNDGILSVTISAADSFLKFSARKIALQIWREILPLIPNLSEKWGFVYDGINVDANGKSKAMPAYRVIKEKKAGIVHSLENERKRPTSEFFFGRNILLAGDWTDTQLPCTVEGSVYSGFKSANIVLSFVDQV
ncbi:MAG: NAD(P)-binding protein [Alphaproteobacteria bacterium]|nr:NAD(P)-binding protein [Alphaproteobacteria bacterium]